MSDHKKTAGALGAAGVSSGAAALSGVAGACCAGPVLAPLFVSVLGAGGAAWAASLEPYSPYLVIGSGVLLAYAFWSLYRRTDTCAPDDVDVSEGQPRGRRVAVVVVWGALVVWVGALVLNLFVS